MTNNLYITPAHYDRVNDTIRYKDHKIENFFGSFTQQKYQVDYVKNNLIMLCVGGSHAYGLDTETSDVDIRGIFKDNIDQLLGLEKIEQLNNDTNDITIYSLSKIIQLIAEQNPNCLELLWLDEEEIIYASDDYWYIRKHRDQLLSSLSRQKFSGYAISQLGRIKGHDKWLEKEKTGKFEHKPHIKDYIICVNHKGFINRGIQTNKHFYFTKVKDEIYNIWRSTNPDCPLIEDGNNFVPVQESNKEVDEHKGILIFNKSQFQLDSEEYNNWKKWKDNRNVTRHELEEKFGYDAKHALHTFRLLRMGLEILRGEGVQVKRKDAPFLMDIRNGKYTLEWILKEAEVYDKVLMDEAYETTTLPRSVDKKVWINIIKTVLGV